MKFFITGGTGFVGRNIIQTLIGNGNEVIATGRSSLHPIRVTDNFTYLSCDTSHKGSWQKSIEQCDVVINLAGESIIGRWSAKTREKIYNSRIKTTSNIVSVMDSGQALISASASGIYGDRGDDVLDEKAKSGTGFLADVCVDWEGEAFSAKDGVRVAVFRLGVVLGRGGGVIDKMKTPFKLGIGGRLGSGKQWFPWIHIDDVINALIFLSNEDMCSGIFNFSAPEQVTNEFFTKEFAKSLNVRAIIPVSSMGIKLLLGESASVLLSSQKMIPSRLIEMKYSFKYPVLSESLAVVADN
ncbi:MAG: TIGR01777 family oxidoreductase [Deltaproteobacteria bacterium]|nr:TIGR01777 family oxidoreductase [Deltaproteobacteria bacterium]